MGRGRYRIASLVFRGGSDTQQSQGGHFPNCGEGERFAIIALFALREALRISKNKEETNGGGGGPNNERALPSPDCYFISFFLSLLNQMEHFSLS